jgi:hypothetical protein
MLSVLNSCAVHRHQALGWRRSAALSFHADVWLCVGFQIAHHSRPYNDRQVGEGVWFMCVASGGFLRTTRLAMLGVEAFRNARHARAVSIAMQRPTFVGPRLTPSLRCRNEPTK